MVTLTEAPQNWEIIQQAAGVARVAVAGTYDGGAADESIIWVGALSEDDLAPVVAWQRAEMQNGTFRATLVLPVGGLYRVEVRSVGNEATPPMSAKQWVARHHIGVGDNYLIAGQSNAADLEHARLLSETEIELTFSHLFTLGTFGLEPTRLPIRVSDDEGEVLIHSYTCARERVTLCLARPVTGRVYVSAMDKREEPYYLIDEGTQIPMIAFYRAEATRD